MERNTKLFNFLIGVFILCFACSVSPTTINGRFTVIQIDATKISVILQINTNTGIDDLGGTTMVFCFDTTVVNFPSNPLNDVDYTFHNFNEGNYSQATVTRPMKNQVWVNIDLPYSNNNNGTSVSANPEWTDVATIQFNVVDTNRSVNFSWLTTSPFWGVYDANNLTLWQIGEFEDYPTSVEPGSGELPTSFELSQNYPNPFNPSTKIRYTIPSITASGTKQAQLVTLKVYDILGNEVVTLVNEEKAPGIYEVEFSAANLASGIYIYRLHSSKFDDTKKMVLLR